MAYADVLYEVKNQIAWLTINHARHNGVTGMSRITIDHLVANYYHTDEAKEMGRAFNAKDKPNPDKFYR